MRVGARAKGGGESTGLWPDGLAIFYFFCVRPDFRRQVCGSGSSRGGREGAEVGRRGAEGGRKEDGGSAGFWVLQGIHGGG